ncbi:Arylsulfatase precursor [Stieleria maiorica]|uniref:Arylsulfatase n=2 Tax=Stieleria maiorica TaxID=2795974 RepID=A0A5B9MMY3_9BACT|nr:Arylsulfatase precursor [Stieleria maiorica]
MMTKQRSTWLAFVLMLLVATFGLADDRPNVILIVTDDQGYGDMSCHGNPFLQTPNLDRLAGQSVRLENYHVDPVCTPTRAALMTGRYSTRVGAWDVVQGRQLLDPDEVTMAGVFSAAGYRTAMFGKWHLGDTWPYAPRYRGFQEVVRHLAGGIDEIGNPIGNDYFDDTYYRNGTRGTIEGYCTDVFFDQCERFIGQSSESPFFVYLPLNAMHSPHTVAKRYYEPFLAEGHNEKRAKFFGQIINFDKNLGRLLELLDARKLAENTILIFMSDNGTAEGVDREGGSGYNAAMRGKKGSVYEGGHRVACFVRWPAELQAGRRIHQLTCCRDWLPTLIDWCGLSKSKDVTFDGRSLQPLIRGGADSWPERTLFIQRQPDRPRLVSVNQGRSRYAVLTQRWRLVGDELYDIINDPSQTTDVAAKHPEVVRELRSQYERHFADVFADGGAYTRFQIGAAEENPTLLTVRDWHPTNGNVIWKQDQLGDDALTINGFWAIHVVTAGRYTIRLSRFPDDAPAPMGADRAVLKIGDKQWSKRLGGDETSVTFNVELPQGPAILSTFLTDQQGEVRGAYFVHAERLGVSGDDDDTLAVTHPR